MRQRGRKSADSLAVLSVNGKQPRLSAPPSLDDNERALFDELVAACYPSHFRESDIPLLISFVQATLIAQGTAHDPSKAALWERAVRMQATLATRLRLAPQSRVDPKTLGRQQLPAGPRPWE
jgi:hypothetical protein